MISFRRFSLVLVLTSAFATKFANPQAANNHSKTYPLSAESAGDCRLVSGSITLHEDGRGSLDVKTLTYHTSNVDIWHISFEAVSPGGSTLFHIGDLDGPKMKDGNPPPEYSWARSFHFDPSLYTTVSKFNLHSKC